MMAMAKGVQSTTWAMMMEIGRPDKPTCDSQASMASPMMTSGIVGGSRARAR